MDLESVRLKDVWYSFLERLIHVFEVKEKVCPNCEYLKMLLEQEKAYRDKLLDNLSPKEVEVEEREFKPIIPKYIPWSIKRQQLEKDDREKYLRKNEELEKELGING